MDESGCNRFALVHGTPAALRDGALLPRIPRHLYTHVHLTPTVNRVMDRRDRSQGSLRLFRPPRCPLPVKHTGNVIDWNQSSLVASLVPEKARQARGKKSNCHCSAVNNCLRRCDATVRFPTRFSALPSRHVAPSFPANSAPPFACLVRLRF